MASKVGGPVGNRIALGLPDGSRTLDLPTLTVVHSALICILALGAFGLACRETPQGEAVDCTERQLRMGVASSLREVALFLRQRLSTQSDPIDVEMIFGASSVHAHQLELGAPIDVLVSADAEIIDRLVRRGRLIRDSTVEIARGQLVLIAKAGWQGGSTSIETLDSRLLQRIAIPSAAVPLGRYARAWLDGQDRLEALAGRIVTTEHARATLSAVEAGHVDLAVVYDSDARLAKRALVVAKIDLAEYPPIRYVAGRATSARECRFIDEALEAWRSPATLEQLERHGFLSPRSTKVAP